MLRLIGDLIYGIGWIVGGIKWRLGIIVHLPQRYRSSRWDQDDESSS